MTDLSAPHATPFELEILGGGVERRYRKMRPEVEAMPWGTLDLTNIPEAARVSSRQAWTAAAFQEHRTGVACALTLRALLEARAPLDLVAMCTRFPLDEIVHVELCARMAMECGGGTEIVQDPDHLCPDADRTKAPLVRAAELVVRYFCVGEALSIPLLRGAWHAATHPLPRAVLSRIVRDEAAHGTFGYTFLDWASPELDDEARAHIASAADATIAEIQGSWREIRSKPKLGAHEAHALGWMQTDAYLELAARSMKRNVLEPLLARGIPLKSTV